MTDAELPKGVQAYVLCERISQVCRGIGAAVSEIEGQVIESSTLDDGSMGQMMSLQKIDLVLQSIEELATFVVRCQGEIPKDCRINIDANLPLVRLEWMRDVLAGSAGRACRSKSANSTSVLLF